MSFKSLDKKGGKLMVCWCFLLMNYKWIHIIHLPWPFQKTMVSCPSPVRSAVVWWWMCDRANRRGWVRSGVCQNSWALPGSWLESGLRKKLRKLRPVVRIGVQSIISTCGSSKWHLCYCVFFSDDQLGKKLPPMKYSIFFCWGYSFMVIWGKLSLSLCS